MSKQIAAGFFNMEDVNTITKSSSMEDAQKYLNSKIEQFVSEHPGTVFSNVAKATTMITKAKSLKNLAIDVSNFVLAHPSEGLKVIK